MVNNSDSQQQIALVDQQGHKRIYNVLFTFKSDDFHKSYILIYPRSNAGNKSIGIRAYSLPFDEDPANPDSGHLKPIQTQREWQMIQSVFNTLMNDHLM